MLFRSQSFSCPDCGISISEVEPRSFSFNNPFGACPVCFGLGYKMEFDMELMVPNQKLSINQGAIVVLGWQSCNSKGSFTNALLQALCKEYHFDLDTPFEEYPDAVRDVLVTAQGIETIVRKSPGKLRQTLARIQVLAEEYQVGKIVLGFPKNMNNTEGERCGRTLEFQEMLEKRCGQIGRAHV